MMLLSLVSRQQAGVNSNSASAKSIQPFFFQKFEIILIGACDNYDGFQHLTFFILSRKFVSLF
jgi:hypothetical protein